jgi:replicative DNA helicase
MSDEWIPPEPPDPDEGPVRETPHDVLAEQSVLGSLMISASQADEVLDMIRPADFYEPRHTLICEAIDQLHQAGDPTDVLAVTDRLRGDGALDRVGGPVYLHELVDVPAAATSAPFYARIVRDRAVARRLIEFGQHTAAAGFAGAVSPEALDQAQADLAAVAGLQSVAPEWIGAAFPELVGSLEHEPSYTPTPWPELNDLIGGLRPGALYIVGGRPGGGKSIVAGQLAIELAGRGAVAVSSLEMPRSAVLSRMVSAVGSIEQGSLSRHELTREEWDRFAGAKTAIDRLPISVDDRSGVTVADVKAFARAVGRKQDLAGVVVDYLQLISPVEGSRQSSWEMFGEAARQFKVLARQLDVPVVLLSQLNRESVMPGRGKQAPRLPTLADLSRSDAIGHHADCVLLLARKHDSEGNVLPELDVVVAKNRQGRTGVRTLDWEGQYARLSSRQLGADEGMI